MLGLIGMFTSTKIHTEGGIDDAASEVDAAQQKVSAEEESEEVVEKEIVWDNNICLLEIYHKQLKPA